VAIEPLGQHNHRALSFVGELKVSGAGFCISTLAGSSSFFIRAGSKATRRV